MEYIYHAGMKRLPDLEAWAIFAKVAETGSFARAAAELSLSQATVSKAITRLEARMQTTLFHRTTRRMSLTESGQAALEHATRILEEGEALEAELVEQSHSLRGLIRLTVPMSFGLNYVAPLLPAFLQQHPEVRLDIAFSDDKVDLVGERFDLALRISNLVDSSLLARRLCTVRILLVGTPDYFARHGKPRHPRDLARHQALQYAYARGGVNWSFRHARQGEITQPTQGQLRVNNAEGLMPALLAGLGLALQPEFLVWRQLQSGELITAMDDWQAPSVALHTVTPPGRRRPARVQALMDYLAVCLANAPWALHENVAP